MKSFAFSSQFTDHLSNESDMSDQNSIGAHDGGIPPGWDFPEARQAAADGIDLWLLDSMLRLTPWERVQAAANAARLMKMAREADLKKYGA